MLIALYLGALGLTVSSFTGRKSIATAIIFIGFAVLEGFTNALIAAFDSQRANERARH